MSGKKHINAREIVGVIELEIEKPSTCQKQVARQRTNFDRYDMHKCQYRVPLFSIFFKSYISNYWETAKWDRTFLFSSIPLPYER